MAAAYPQPQYAFQQQQQQQQRQYPYQQQQQQQQAAGLSFAGAPCGTVEETLTQAARKRGRGEISDFFGAGVWPLTFLHVWQRVSTTQHLFHSPACKRRRTAGETHRESERRETGHL